MKNNNLGIIPAKIRIDCLSYFDADSEVFESIGGIGFDFDTEQMIEIDLGIKHGLGKNVLKYINPDFNSDQMRQLRLGFEAGLDMSRFCCPAISAHYLEDVRQNMMDGVEMVFIPDIKMAGNWNLDKDHLPSTNEDIIINDYDNEPDYDKMIEGLTSLIENGCEENE